MYETNKNEVAKHTGGGQKKVAPVKNSLPGS